MSVTGDADGQPIKVGAAVVDLVCGLLAVAGIEAALVERERTGAGRHVEVSLLDSVLTSLLNQGSGWVSAGALPTRRGNRHPSIAPYETYEAADRPFAVACGNERLFARLCEAIGLPDLPDDERFATNTARVEHIAELGEALEAVFKTEPAAPLGRGPARRERPRRPDQRRRRGVRDGRRARPAADRRGRRPSPRPPCGRYSPPTSAAPG